MYIASLDASKAFDRINHYKLFSTLIKRGFPMSFTNMICNWYGKLVVKIRWNGQESSSLVVASGVRQGGILSPVLFNLYVDCILVTLRAKTLGCHLHNVFAGCLMYADDLLLVSASVIDLQIMLNVTGDVGRSLGLTFNCMKSNCVSIGCKKIDNLASLTINGTVIQWANSIKYLGICISAGKSFKTDLSMTRRKFFASVNCILSKCQYTSDIVKLQLVESHCLPILLYACESLNLKGAELQSLNSWWNSVYRKIFHYHKWESVKEIIHFLGRLDLVHLVNLRQMQFIKKLSICDNNSALKTITKMFIRSSECFALFAKFNSSIFWTCGKIKAMLYVSSRHRFGILPTVYAPLECI